MLEPWCVFTDLAHDGNVQITVVFKRQSDCSEKKKKKHLLLFSVSVSVHCINKRCTVQSLSWSNCAHLLHPCFGPCSPSLHYLLFSSILTFYHAFQSVLPCLSNLTNGVDLTWFSDLFLVTSAILTPLVSLCIRLLSFVVLRI